MQNKLTQLVKSTGISGYETMGDIITAIQSLAGFPGEVFQGNLVYSVGKGKKTVFLSAHMDEVGFFVSQVSKTFVQLVPIGDIDIKDLAGEKLILAKNASVSKTIKPSKNFATLKIFGFQDPAVGDICTFSKDIIVSNNFYQSACLDNRVSCLALIEVLGALKNVKLPYRLIISFVGREEVSVNGLMSVVKKYQPDLCLDVDSAYALPVSKKKRNWQIPTLGKGPAIQLLGNGFIIPSEIRLWIEEVAQKANLHFQYEIPGDNEGGTNARTLISAGYQTAQINIPVFNQHSAKSRVALTDIQNTTTLILELLKNAERLLK